MKKSVPKKTLYRWAFVAIAVIPLIVLFVVQIGRPFYLIETLILLTLWLSIVRFSYNVFIYAAIYRNAPDRMATLIYFGAAPRMSRRQYWRQKYAMVQFYVASQFYRQPLFAILFEPPCEIGKSLEVKHWSEYPDKVILADKKYFKQFAVRTFLSDVVPVIVVWTFEVLHILRRAYF